MVLSRVQENWQSWAVWSEPEPGMLPLVLWFSNNLLSFMWICSGPVVSFLVSWSSQEKMVTRGRPSALIIAEGHLLEQQTNHLANRQQIAAGFCKWDLLAPCSIQSTKLLLLVLFFLNCDNNKLEFHSISAVPFTRPWIYDKKLFNCLNMMVCVVL